MSLRAKKIVLSAALLFALTPATGLLTAPAQAAGAANAGAVDGAAAAPSSGGTSEAQSSAAGGQAPGGSHSAAPASQEGVSLATWFGPGLFGEKTACGQVLTRALVGVANRTLRCGTLVKVSFHGHSLTVPVVDRGPYGPLHAKWDLTQAAARQLRMAETSKVDAVIVGHIQNSPELGLPPGAQAPHAAKPLPTAGSTGGAAAS